MESRAFIVGLIVGILATVTRDFVAVIALRFGIAGWGPRRTGPDLIGRWIGYLLRGKFRHTDILQTPPLRGELLPPVVERPTSRASFPASVWSTGWKPISSANSSKSVPSYLLSQVEHIAKNVRLRPG